MHWLCIGYSVVYRSHNTIAVLLINSIVRTKMCLFFGKSRYFGHLMSKLVVHTKRETSVRVTAHDLTRM